jgi:hypothetical protein
MRLPTKASKAHSFTMTADFIKMLQFLLVFCSQIWEGVALEIVTSVQDAIDIFCCEYGILFKTVCCIVRRSVVSNLASFLLQPYL